MFLPVGTSSRKLKRRVRGSLPLGRRVASPYPRCDEASADHRAPPGSTVTFRSARPTDPCWHRGGRSAADSRRTVVRTWDTSQGRASCSSGLPALATGPARRSAVRQCPVHGMYTLKTRLSSPVAVRPALVIDEGRAGHSGPISHESEPGAWVPQPVYPGGMACDHSERSAVSRRGDLYGGASPRTRSRPLPLPR